MAKRAPVSRNVKGKEQSHVEMVGLEVGKVPPQAIDMEEAVLGALLLEPNASLTSWVRSSRNISIRKITGRSSRP